VRNDRSVALALQKGRTLWSSEYANEVSVSLALQKASTVVCVRNERSVSLALQKGTTLWSSASLVSVAILNSLNVREQVDVADETVSFRV
jgi:hypothetical protein